jgi:hypothetical protein
MVEVLSKFDSGELIGLVAVLGTFGCGALGIIMGVGYAIRKMELAAGLKKAMLERGMSAEEIRMVMDAGERESLEHPKKSVYSEV